MMRYSRQETVLGKKIQQKIEKATVAIIGVGALGSVIAELLTRSGIGKLILVDRDIVEESNLQRQALYTEKDIGKPKVFAALERLKEINGNVDVEVHFADFTHKNVDVIKYADLFVDGTDNLQTRFLLNEYASSQKKPWIHGSAIGKEGYFGRFTCPCFACFVKPASLATCEDEGVLNTLSHSIASMQAELVIETLSGNNETVLYYYSNKQISKLKVPLRKDCDVCKGKYLYLNGKGENIVKLCGKNTFQFTASISYADFKRKKSVKDLGFGLKLGEVMLFKDGRVFVHAPSEREAKSIFAKFVGDYS